jgi:LuxR family maltose regulon positive regulatory protein
MMTSHSMSNSGTSSDSPIRRGKIRQPVHNRNTMQRPRLTTRLDDCLHVPLTLVSAPAGFGKTTLLSEWAGRQTHPVAWLTVDADDRDLSRMVMHLVAAIDTVVPSIGDRVHDLLNRPRQVSAAEIGVWLADELLDLPHDIVLIVDDYHLAASGDIERFLAGLLRSPAPHFHLLLATRRDPALPLARMRFRGQLQELRASDLRFSLDETATLLATSGHAEASPALIDALHEQIGGWIAGLRLALLILPTITDPARIGEIVAGEQHVMDVLVDEVLTAQPEAVQKFLLRTAVVDRFCASLADALLAHESISHTPEILEWLLREGLMLEPSPDEWLHYHPLFRSLLRHQLDIRLPPETIADLHARASAWFAAQGLIAPAIQHLITAGDTFGAASLVEEHVFPALRLEDWNAVADWLEMLPESIIHTRPVLLLAKMWISHFSGRWVPIRNLVSEFNALLSTLEGDRSAIAELESQRDALLSIRWNLAIDQDPHEAVAFARRVVDQVPDYFPLAAGVASVGLGAALQTLGRTEEAIHWLTDIVEQGEERIDARSIRALMGLMFVHRAAGNVRASEETAQYMLVLAERQDFPLSAGWAHWLLGWLAYEHDELEAAHMHFALVVADRRRVHLRCTCEAMFGLALVYQAKQLPVDVASTLKRLLEILFENNALEYLPNYRAFVARLALLQGEPWRAIDWLESEEGVTVACNSLYAFDHAFLTRIKILLAIGSPESVTRARADLEMLQAITGARNQRSQWIETLALTAMARAAQGETQAALATLRESIALGGPAGFRRTYLELKAGLGPLCRQLAQSAPRMDHLEPLLAALDDAESRQTRTESELAGHNGVQVLEVLTTREAEVLEHLHRRLSYQEIGEALFISPQTVKSHVTKIYEKLGVGNRREALLKAQSLGWLARH